MGCNFVVPATAQVQHLCGHEPDSPANRDLTAQRVRWSSHREQRGKPDERGAHPFRAELWASVARQDQIVVQEFQRQRRSLG